MTAGPSWKKTLSSAASNQPPPHARHVSTDVCWPKTVESMARSHFGHRRTRDRVFMVCPHAQQERAEAGLVVWQDGHGADSRNPTTALVCSVVARGRGEGRAFWRAASTRSAIFCISPSSSHIPLHCRHTSRPTSGVWGNENGESGCRHRGQSICPAAPPPNTAALKARALSMSHASG